MRLNHRFEQWPGSVEFIDTDHQRFVRGGATVDAAHAMLNRGGTQGQAVFRNNRLTALSGSIIGQNPATGLFEIYTPDSAAVAAELETGVEADNNAITWTAVAAGETGNSIQISYVIPAPSTALSIATVGLNIEVTLATDAGGTVTSDAAAVIAAVNADGNAGALIQGASTGASTGAGIMEAMDLTPFDGGQDVTTENLVGRRALILYGDLDLQDGNAAGTGIDHGRVISARLPLTPDAIVLAALPNIVFI